MRQQGFTIIECMMSLLVLAMITVLIHLVLPNAMHLKHSSLKNKTDWYLFVERLEDPRYRFRVLKVERNILILKSNENEEYQVQEGHNALFLRTKHGGYLPVLVNYQLGSIQYWQLNNDNVYVNAKMMDGEQEDAVINFSPGR